MPYFPTLSGEIARRGIKKKAIADALNICTRALNTKMNGRVPFSGAEVKLIRSQFFPDMSPDDLFMTNAS